MVVEIEKVPMDAWSWIGAVAQKITMARLRVIDHRDIPEEDMPLLKLLFRAWHNEEFPIYETKMEGIVEDVSQSNLFSDVSSSIECPCEDGIGFEYTTSQTKDKETDE